MQLFNALPDSQALLAVFILLATLVYEDGATLLAAALSASGRLNPWFGLITTFLGIWIGDLGLYALGSSVGRRVAWSNVARKYLSSESLARGEAWFARHGSFALVMSRAIPGSRLPLYTAAGALRFSVALFAKTTAVCAGLWVGTIFAIWRFVPAASPERARSVSLVLTLVLLLAPWVVMRTARLLRRAARGPKQSAAGSVCAR